MNAIVNSESVKFAFSNIFDRTLASVYKNKLPVAVNNNGFVIGDLEIKYNDGLYSIEDKFTKKILYKDIYLIEAAFLLAKYNQLNLVSSMPYILKLEEQYAKHYLDMQSYAHACAVAKKSKNYDKMEIAESRYACSKFSAAHVRSKLKLLCDKIIKKR